MEQNEDLRRGLESMAAESTEYFGKMQEVQRRVAEIVGMAASEDDMIKVSWRGDGPSDLEIHPRAMRMGSGELAATIMRLIGAAKADSRRQSDDVMAEVYGEENPADLVRDPAALRQSLDAMRRTFSGAVDESMDLIKQLQGRLGK
jgi:DNA-binding protein YbaB